MKSYIHDFLSRKINNSTKNFMYLSDHEDLTINIVKEYPDAPWEWETIQEHDNFSLNWLISFPYAQWNWKSMHLADAFDPYWLCIFQDKPWNWEHLHKSKQFDFSWIEYAPHADWNWDKLSEMTTIELLQKKPNYPWVWSIVTAYSDISVETMMEHLEFPWDVSLIRFDKITHDEIPFLRHFRDRFDEDAWIDFTRFTDWKVLKTNSDLNWVPFFFTFTCDEFEEDDMEFLLNYPLSLLNWVKLSLSVPFKTIKKYPNLPWNFEFVSLNNTVTYDDVEEFPEKNWDHSVTPCVPKEILLLRWVSASKIKRAWRKAITNPIYTLCKNRIAREFSEISPNNVVK